MKRLLNIIILCAMATMAAMAQNYTITGEVDQVVHKGERFHLRYKFNSTDVRDFKPGAIPSGLVVLIGPNQSVRNEIVSINGQSRRTEEVTLTYVLLANDEGKFTIPPATAIVGGQTLKSQPLTVQVVPSNEKEEAPTATSENIFVRLSASKRRVSLYEPFLLTVKVYWNVDLPVRGFDPFDLKVQDAYVQGYNDTQQKSVVPQTVNGKTLLTVDWAQYIIYPQKPGKLTIPASTLMSRLVEYVPLGPGFSSSNDYQRPLQTPALDIEVVDLPDRPTDFSGGAGKFTISAQLDKSEVKENVPVTLTVKVKGTGNLNMLREPVVTFPKGFDTYDTKSTDNYRLTAEGLDGSVTYDFMAVPQRKGSYVIPPARLTYFDLASRSYKTVQTDSFRLEVLKGDGTAGAIHDFSGGAGGTQEMDIHSIRTGKDRSANGQAFFASTPYYAAMAALVATFLVVFFVLRYREKGQADVAKSKGRRANKVAVRKLRKAAKLMRIGKPGEFYDETLRALWGYVGDKLNIPVSQLSRENISQSLLERGVDEQVTATFIEAIDECEFVRYAPGDPQGNMSRVYDKSVTAIEQIESVKNKTKGSRKAMLLTLPLIICQLTLGTVSAQTKVQADEAYSQEEYEQAITLYQEVLEKNGATADVYYNMGNAYFRLDSMARAILCYERALLLQPGDDDARFNLQLANARTVDKIAPEREMFFVTWYRSLVNVLGVDTWAYIALVALASAVVLLLVYFFAFEERVRRLSFFAATMLLAVFLLSNLFAWQQRRALAAHDGAIVMYESLPVKNIPADNGNDEFTIHAGTKVTITDNTMADWKHVLLPDGREGWVPATALEII